MRLLCLALLRMAVELYKTQVIEDLDAHLLGIHGILLEDLPLTKLQEFLEDPSIFDKDSEALQETWKELYGSGRMPIPTAETQACFRGVH